jgi:hypothetical protein
MNGRFAFVFPRRKFWNAALMLFQFATSSWIQKLFGKAWFSRLFVLASGLTKALKRTTTGSAAAAAATTAIRGKLTGGGSSRTIAASYNRTRRPPHDFTMLEMIDSTVPIVEKQCNMNGEIYKSPRRP